MDLALDDQRIDDAAEIVGAGEVDKLDRARLAINFDLGKTKGSLYCWAIAAHPESLGCAVRYAGGRWAMWWWRCAGLVARD
jgi:hypothetical protein